MYVSVVVALFGYVSCMPKCLSISSDVLFQENHLQLGFKTILEAMCHRSDANSPNSVRYHIYIRFVVFRSTTSCLDWDSMFYVFSTLLVH